MAIPAIIAGITEPVISLVDTALIGHIGTQELAAIGIASSFFLIVIWALAQTKTSISAIVSFFYGKNELSKLSVLIPQVLLFNILLGLVFLFITSFFDQEIFQFYGAKNQVLTHALAYFKIRSWGFPITLATFCLFGVFRGIQNTKWAMTIGFVGGGVNLILDLVLIYGIPHYIEPMGVKGAAIATLIAQLIMLSIAVYFLISKTKINLKLEFLPDSELKKFILIFGNLFIRTAALNVAYLLSTKYATKYGTQYVAAHSIAMNIWLFSAFFTDGYANAGNAISGKLLGENNSDKLKILGEKIIKYTLVITFILAVSYSALYRVIPYFFTNDLLTIKIFNSIFWLVILSQPINAIAFALDGFYKGMGRAKLLRNTLLISTFVGFVPILLSLDYLNYNIYSVWWALVGWMVFRSGILWYKFQKEYT